MYLFASCRSFLKPELIAIDSVDSIVNCVYSTRRQVTIALLQIKLTEAQYDFATHLNYSTANSSIAFRRPLCSNCQCLIQMLHKSCSQDLDVLHPNILSSSIACYTILTSSFICLSHKSHIMFVKHSQGLEPQPPVAALESSEKALKYNSNFL